LNKDIAIAQLKDPSMSTPPLKPNDVRLISPDTSAIKKKYLGGVKEAVYL
jgi:hypothetical protein